jgi:hypothetical protein
MLEDIEDGIASTWANNFTNGYIPLMDSGTMVYTLILGPLLEAFLRDGVFMEPEMTKRLWFLKLSLGLTPPFLPMRPSMTRER